MRVNSSILRSKRRIPLLFGLFASLFLALLFWSTPANAVPPTTHFSDGATSVSAPMAVASPLLFIGADTNVNTTAGDQEIVCVGGPLGYITCPLIGIASKMVKGIANFLGNLFNFQALNNSGLRESWGIFTNLANIILAIAFLVVVMSQASSIGISNYGVKRILPRVIAGAILINMSFYVCALAIDVSNVLGRNMLEFTASLSANVEGGGVSGGSTSGGAGEEQRECGDRKAKHIVGQKVACFFDIIEIGMAGGFLVATIFIFVMLIATFIAFTITLALVIMRYVILIFLVLLAPLAFAAWVLPNTEQYFQKWWSMFLKMLLIYPAAMFLFGGSLFVADILADINIGEMFNDTGLPTEVMQAMMASFQLFIIAMPLFFIPKLFKGMDSVTGGLAGKMAAMGSAGAAYKLGKKGAKMGGKAAAPYAKFGAAALTDKMAANKGQLGWMTRGARARMAKGRARKLAVNQALDARKAGRQAQAQEQAADIGMGSNRISGVGGTRYSEYAAAQKDKAMTERVQSRLAQYKQDQTSLEDIAKQVEQAMRSNGDADSVAALEAAGRKLSVSGAGGQAMLKTALERGSRSAPGGTSPEMQKATSRLINDGIFGDVVGKRGDIAKGGFNAEGHFDTSTAVSKLGTGQLASQSAATLADNFSQISQESAKVILENESLNSTVSDDAARAILQARSSGATQLPTQLQVHKTNLDKDYKVPKSAPTPTPVKPPTGTTTPSGIYVARSGETPTQNNTRQP